MRKPPAHSLRPAPAPPSARHATHWADVADWYDALVGDEGSEYHRQVIVPGVLRMLGDKGPLTILDLACGQGVLCRRLAAMGHDVTGIDAAEPLIVAARQRGGPDAGSIHYRVADITRLRDASGRPIPGLEPESFDAATLILAVQNLSPLSPLWQACRELLKPAGVLIIVMMHPCFRVPKASDWHWEDASGTQARLVRRYLSSDRIAIQTHPGLAAHGKDHATTTHFHRPLQAYINTLGNAGLLIDHIAEWPSHKKSQPGPRKNALDQARKEIPMFLALRARKV